MHFAFTNKHAEVKATAEDGQPDEYFRDIPCFPGADPSSERKRLKPPLQRFALIKVAQERVIPLPLIPLPKFLFR